MSPTYEELTATLSETGILTPEELLDLHRKLAPDGQAIETQRLCVALELEGKLTHFQSAAMMRGEGHSLILGQYVLQDHIGSGGMGEVFKACHRLMKRTVAIKMLPPATSQDHELKERFHREVRAAAKLTHPNIVTAHDAGEQDGSLFLVSEYVEGKTLGAVARDRGALPLLGAINCVLQAARGLSYAHHHGVVHRDVKPGNLMLDKNGVVKVLDLGLAKLRDDKAGTEMTMTPSGHVVGTPEYLPPEQALNAAHADNRADIYSLGCTMYRLLTGEVPYPGRSALQAVKADRETVIPRLEDKVPGVTEELQRVFERMVAHEPSDRFHSMDELIRELESLFPDAGSHTLLPAPLDVSTATTHVVETPGTARRRDDSLIGSVHRLASYEIARPRMRWGMVFMGVALAAAVVFLGVLYSVLLQRAGVEVVEDGKKYTGLAAYTVDVEWQQFTPDPKKLPPESNAVIDREGVLRFTGSLILSEVVAGNAIIRANVTLSKDAKEVILGLRFTSSRGCAVTVYREGKAGPWKCRLGEITLNPHIETQNIWDIADLPVSLGDTFDLALVMRDDELRVFIDDALLLKATATEITSGSPMLSSDGVAGFSRVKVMVLDRTPDSKDAGKPIDTARAPL